MDNQVTRAEFLLEHSHAFDLSDMGTGKTYTSVWAMDHLLNQVGGSGIVFTTVSTLDAVWGKSYAAIFGPKPSRPVFVLPQVGEKRTHIVRTQKDAIFITNYDALNSAAFFNAVLESDIVHTVRDETTALKHFNTERSKTFRRLSQKVGAWGLTATPMPNTPMEAYGIARATIPEYNESMVSYRSRTHERDGPFGWKPKDNAFKMADAILKPSIRVLAADAFKKTGLSIKAHAIKMSPELARVYKELAAKSVIELKGKKVSAPHEAALRNKLLQVAGGALYTNEAGEERSHQLITVKDRTDGIVALTQHNKRKVVVLVPYTIQVDYVVKELRLRGLSVLAMPKKPKDRANAIDAFQSLADPRVLVADPRTLAHGVELTRASILVFYLPVDSNELYQQAIGRLVRRGQTQDVDVYQLSGTKLETAIYTRLTHRQSLQGLLLEALV